MENKKEILDRLRKEGKVTTLNRPEDIKAMEKMNKSVEKTKREYAFKNFRSELAASETILR